MKTVRIIPMTMATAALLMAVKMIEVARGTDALSGALAQQAQPGAPADSVNVPKPATPDAGAGGGDQKLDAASFAASIAKPTDSKAPAAPAPAPVPEKKEEPKKDDAAAGDKKDAPKDADKDKKPDEAKDDKNKNPAVSDVAGQVVDRHYTKVELDLLQSLSARREELDRWENNIQIKEAALDATEKRIDDKIQQIDAMKMAVSTLLAQYNEKEDAKIRSLVKIYENMKPKEAATIFNELEMPVLLLIIDKMSEKKSAPVLAEMNPQKAKQITVELAQQRRLNSTKLSAATGAAGAIPASPTAPAASSPAPTKTAQQ